MADEPPPPRAPRTPRSSAEAAAIRAAYGVGVRRRSLLGKPLLAGLLEEGPSSPSSPSALSLLERLPTRLINAVLSFLELTRVVARVSLVSRAMFRVTADERYWKQVETASFRRELPKPSLVGLLTMLREARFHGCLGDTGARVVARSCRSLRALRVVGDADISAAGVEALAAANPRLAVLELRFCARVDDEAVEAAVLACGARLEEVTVASCGHVGNDAVRALAAGAPRLRVLDLNNCAVLDTGVRALAEGACGRTLERLNLAACRNVTDMAAEALADLGCPALARVSFFATSLSDEGVRHLARLPALQSVNAMQCVGVTPSGVAALEGCGVSVVRAGPSRAAGRLSLRRRATALAPPQQPGAEEEGKDEGDGGGGGGHGSASEEEEEEEGQGLAPPPLGPR